MGTLAELLEEEIRAMDQRQEEEYRRLLNLIEEGFAAAETAYLSIAFALYEINAKQLFQLENYKNITDFAYDKYDMKKSQVYSYISVVARFGDCRNGSCSRLLPEYEAFNISQLAKLVDVPAQYLPEFRPEWPVKKIIEHKNRLKETVILQRTEGKQMELPLQEPEPLPGPESVDVCIEDDMLVGRFIDPAELGKFLGPISDIVEGLQGDKDTGRRYHFEIRLCWE